MRNKQALIAGLAGTAAMTMAMFMAPLMGLPKMNAAAMLSMMLGIPLFLGWLMHAMIGAGFAMLYALFFQRVVKSINSPVVRGLLFGFAVFIMAQVAMAVMGAMMGGGPAPAGGMLPMMLGSMIGHLIYGTVVALLLRPATVTART